MISQAVLTSLVRQSYDPIPIGLFDKVVTFQDATACLKRVNDTLTISLPGTESEANVKTDIDVEVFAHSILGGLHEGFWTPVPGLASLLLDDLKKAPKVSIAGHSEGAARAGCLALWCWLNGVDVAQLSLYESPRFCFARGQEILAQTVANGTNAVSTQNGNEFVRDPVPHLPLDLPPLFPYVFPFPNEPQLKLISIEPGGWLEDMNPLGWHDMRLIEEWGQTD